MHEPFGTATATLFEREMINTGTMIENFWRCLRTAGIVFLMILFAAGCNKDDICQDIAPVRTILYYMGGDNNLSGEVAVKTARLQNVLVPQGCRLLVYCDTRGGDPQLLDVGNGRISPVCSYPADNSADPAVFAAVFDRVRNLYPAPSYGLAVFSHASGWMPAGSYASLALRSIVTDGADEMEIPAFAAAIPDGSLDFILFEACHMAGIEVAWELKTKTRHIVASSAELVSPGFDPVYEEAMPLLFQPKADLEGFCRIIEANYQRRGAEYASLTLSLIATAGLDEIASVLHGEQPCANNDVQSFDRYGKGLFYDLYDGYRNLSDDKRATLRSAIDACVVWKGATAEFMPSYGGFSIRFHSGLTTYIPNERRRELNEAYKKTAWHRELLK